MYRTIRATKRQPVPTRHTVTLFDATQRRQLPYFAFGLKVPFTPYYRSPASIADLVWAAHALNQRTAEQEWDQATIDETLADEAAVLDRYAKMSL